MAAVPVGFGDALHEDQLARRFAGLKEVELGQLGRDHVAGPLARNLFIGRDGALEIAVTSGLNALYEAPFAKSQIVKVNARAGQQRSRGQYLCWRLRIDISAGRVCLKHRAIGESIGGIENRTSIGSQAQKLIGVVIDGVDGAVGTGADGKTSAVKLHSCANSWSC